AVLGAQAVEIRLRQVLLRGARGLVREVAPEERPVELGGARQRVVVLADGVDRAAETRRVRARSLGSPGGGPEVQVSLLAPPTQPISPYGPDTSRIRFTVRRKRRLPAPRAAKALC